jgi:long-chain acyl-CoA synthetase
MASRTFRHQAPEEEIRIMSTRALTASVPSAFQATVAAHSAEPALMTPDGAISWTWGEYARRVRDCSAGLAGLGLWHGHAVACWLSNRPEFHAVDLAAAHLGAASFSVYPTYTAAQAGHVIGDAGARILVTERQFLDRALAVREAGTTALETIVCLEGGDASTLSWEELFECATGEFDAEAAAAAVDPDDVLTLIYTSGTTGPPKGVELTHRNVMSAVVGASERLRLRDGQRMVSWLPMAHIAERLCSHYLGIAHGCRVTTCPDPRAIASLLQQVRPQAFFSPPRLWEKLRSSVLASFDGDLDAAATQRSAVLSKLGLDALDTALVGAAPCPPEVISFWHALGIPLSEVYGMSETTGLVTLNPPEGIRVGTVGTPLPGVEVRLSDEREVLVRGPVVTLAYRNLPDATAEAIDGEGWLHTGDVGEFDEDGYLRIVDRIKEIIINAAGKNMSPANIEGTLKAVSPLIGVAVCIGDARPFNTALIVLDPEAAAGRDPHDPGTVRLIQEAVDAANERLARVEQIKRFHILDAEWEPGGDELTPTMKLKRGPIAEKYAAEIEAMYA